MKKTLLIAAAALVAGIVSSEAQVYSANVVGYVNVVYPSGANVLVATPLTTGNDVLTNVIQGAPASTTIQLWNPGTATFTGLSFTGPASNRHWKDTSGNNQDNTLIGPGISYFVNAGGSSGYTNTYVGTVVPTVGSSVTNVLAAGVVVAAGNLIPYADYVTNTATINLVPPAATVLQLWDPVNQVFNGFSYTGPASNRTWKNTGGTVVYPQIGVAQGFFLQPGGSTTYNWAQTLP